jgi:hypothetical protein
MKSFFSLILGVGQIQHEKFGKLKYVSSIDIMLIKEVTPKGHMLHESIS